MNKEMLNKMESGKGFVAALDQSGGSTPKALELYGIDRSQYNSEVAMFSLVHQMRTRIIKSKSFTSEHILAAILFKVTMDSKIDNQYTADYLWNDKGIVPILKVDSGLCPLNNGVQLMKPIENFDSLLKHACERNIFGTKMRSVIKKANEDGIKKVVKQQFEYAEKIYSYGLIPIIEPEVDINAENKDVCELLLKEQILKHCSELPNETKYMFKLTIPLKPDFYKDLIDNKHSLRVLALSGGYTQKDADKKLSMNHGMIASFSRALSQGLKEQMTNEEFDKTLYDSINSIYNASIK